MKFGLIIYICAFLGDTTRCMNPVKYPVLYNSWYECSQAAHRESVKYLAKLGYAYVNQHQVGIKYNCEIIQTY